MSRSPKTRSLGDSLYDPSTQSWKDIVAAIDRLIPISTSEFLDYIYTVASTKLKTWPREIPRRPPKHWLPETHERWLNLCSNVREVDVYGDYILGICGSPLLRLADGSQAVHLERRFTGATLDHRGQHWVKHGRVGQGDLGGGICLEWWSECRILVRRIEVRLEVEVKVDGGKPSPDQLKRQEIFKRRGGLYVIAFTVDDAVKQIVEFKASVGAYSGFLITHT